MIKHFAGVAAILQRLTEELDVLMGKKKKRSVEAKEQAGEIKDDDLSDLYQKFQAALTKAAKNKKIILVVDGLEHCEKPSRTSKVKHILLIDLKKKSQKKKNFTVLKQDLKCYCILNLTMFEWLNLTITGFIFFFI